MLDKEYAYYIAHRDELLKQYKGKQLLIVGEKVVGVYDSEMQAYQEAIKKYQLGTFLMQLCAPEEETTQTFHSRVIFA